METFFKLFFNLQHKMIARNKHCPIAIALEHPTNGHRECFLLITLKKRDFCFIQNLSSSQAFSE